jgi:hypothetical protein
VTGRGLGREVTRKKRSTINIIIAGIIDIHQTMRARVPLQEREERERRRSKRRRRLMRILLSQRLIRLSSQENRKNNLKSSLMKQEDKLKKRKGMIAQYW